MRVSQFNRCVQEEEGSKKATVYKRIDKMKKEGIILGGKAD